MADTPREQGNPEINYTAAYAFEAEGGRIGISSCKRCGATVLLEPDFFSMAVHDEWHRTHDL